jgi:predicted phosphodiesterase
LTDKRDTARTRASSVHGRTGLVARAGLIGDVHTELTRLQGVLRFFGEQKLQRILCTGDLPDGPNDARAVETCCAALAQAGARTISGNHDRWLQDGEMRDLPGATDRDDLSEPTLDFLAALPGTLEFETPSGLALLCHGLGPDDMAGVRPYDHGHALETNDALQTLLRQNRYRYVISGHTHRPMVRTLSGLTIINAGTLLRDHHPCCAVVDFLTCKIEFYDVAEDGALVPGAEHAL